VFSAGIFFGRAVAGRAFRTSIAGGAALVALVVALLGLDAASRAFTGLDLPFLPLLALVVAIAVYEPVAAWIRRELSEGAPGAARERLLRALGQHDLTVRPADAGVGPALHRLATALDVDGLAVVRPDGTRIAVEGVEPPVDTVRPIPLLADGRTVGELRVGHSTSGRALSDREEELLNLAASYVASALRAGVREEEQAASLDGLVAERAAVEAQAVDLHAALVDHAEPPPGLTVHALGPLHVERAGEPIERWGGDKAGSRQAQAVFAFLFDRGEHGVLKEEVLELVWPDTDLGKADLAFHRTLVGLRQTLEPGVRGRAGSAIRFRNDRYRLGTRIVAWSDVDAFLAALDAARSATSVEERIERLTAARELYRGEYLDDCPFYGDGVHVEETRARLRGRWVDLLLALGEAYESVGDRASAAAAYREAAASPDGCPPAEAGLERLGVNPAREQPSRQNA
jgi:DNA-binding SARP family transcriptional activator